MNLRQIILASKSEFGIDNIVEDVKVNYSPFHFSNVRKAVVCELSRLIKEGRIVRLCRSSPGHKAIYDLSNATTNED